MPNASESRVRIYMNIYKHIQTNYNILQHVCSMSPKQLPQDVNKYGNSLT